MSDRKIALNVYSSSASRDDEVRDELLHMIEWVDKLVSILCSMYSEGEFDCLEL